MKKLILGIVCIILAAIILTTILVIALSSESSISPLLALGYILLAYFVIALIVVPLFIGIELLADWSVRRKNKWKW